MHIDFGYLLSNSPGKGINFERAPFKLTHDFVSILGGTDSTMFRRFRRYLIEGFLALQERAEQLLLMVQMTMSGNMDLPCFIGGSEKVIF